MDRSLTIPIVLLLVGCGAPAPTATRAPSSTAAPTPACSPPPISRTPEAESFNDLSEWLPDGVSLLVPSDHALGARKSGDQGYVTMVFRGRCAQRIELFWYPPLELDEDIAIRMIDAVWNTDWQKEMVEIQNGKFKCLPAYFISMRWSGEGHSGAAESTIVVAPDAIYHLLLTDGENPMSQLYLDIRDSLDIE